uniref:LYR motif-containing protein n=1 Tax=Ananas comosus var. bracteatus TaxID=296719 RepID=A0A6V7QCD2_ANACO|nr:unnamed protein product [Ananas comosus var. bracteatus]
MRYFKGVGILESSLVKCFSEGGGANGEEGAPSVHGGAATGAAAPPETRAYYAKYARENFVNYRDADPSTSLSDLLRRAYAHSTWVLNKYSIDESAAAKLKEICGC